MVKLKEGKLKWALKQKDKKNRRPKTQLTDEEKSLIDKALDESKLCGAVTLRLFIAKYYHKNLPYGKIHRYLLGNKILKPDEKKQKQRKYCRYQRNHSFSLGHMDIHESKAIPGKQVIVWEDDASRNILAGGEFNNATTENAIKIVKEAKRVAKLYSTEIAQHQSIFCSIENFAVSF